MPAETVVHPIAVLAPWLLIGAAGLLAAALTWVLLLVFRLREARAEAVKANQEVARVRQRLQSTLTRARELGVMAQNARMIHHEFLSNISHEVRTPLNTIVGMVGLALTGQLQPKQRAYLKRVREASDTLLGLLNDLLDLAKIHARRLELTPTSFRLHECIGHIAGKFAIRARQKGLHLECTIDPEVPDTVRGDPGRLRQMVGILVSNAVKFTDQGSVRVHVKVLDSRDQNILLHISVSDTGIGVPPEMQGLIFEPFKQADGSPTRRHGGCGLGLAIASELVGLMGGRLCLESTVGRGSTFHFTVCLGLPEGTPAPEASDDAADLRGLRVLLVSGDAQVRGALESLITELGMSALSEDTADGAVAAARYATDQAGRFDLAVLGDRTADGTDGFSLAARLLQDPPFNGVPVILVSSTGCRGDAGRCCDLGVSAYLPFPISPSDFAAAALLVIGSPSASEQRRPLVTAHTLRECRRLLEQFRAGM
jgi:signal transduction histidine kinase/CheY-like chemotaxis protein